MKPVDQILFCENGDRGDCQRACIASLLELDIADVPHFNEEDDAVLFHKSLNRFLRNYGLIHIETSPVNFSQVALKEHAPCYHMIYGESPRGNYHAVVALDGVIVHDPHPSRLGLVEDKKDDWTFAWLVRCNT